ncbi:putative ribosomal N-acetyltransferase YdaF [compost metagenome]
MKDIKLDNYFWQDEVVRLRAIQPEDWEEHYNNRFDTPARRLLNYVVELPPTIAEAKSFAEEFADFAKSYERIMFTIETMNGENLGGINLCGIDERNGTFGIGIQINRDDRGKGYGTRAMKILLRYAYFERRLNKFNVSVLEGNDASAMMMQKLGCVQEGVRRQIVYSNGRYHDEILYGMTKEEFEQINNIPHIG